MSSAKSQFDKPRLNQLFDDLNATLKDFIRKHQVTYAEYHRALAFLTEVGEKGETPLPRENWRRTLSVSCWPCPSCVNRIIGAGAGCTGRGPRACR